MQRICPAFGDHHHLASHGHAIFGAEGVGDHAVLPDPFKSERTAVLGRGGAVGQIRHDGAVQQVVVRAQRSPIAAEPEPDRRRSHAQISLLRDSGCQQRQVNEVAAIERKFGHLALVHEPTQCPGCRVHYRGVFRNDHCLFDRTGLEREIYYRFLGNRQSQTAAHFGPEAGQFHPHFIAAYRERRQPVRAVFSAHAGASKAGLGILRGDGSAWNNGARGVLDPTQNRAGGQLGHRQFLHYQ